MKLTCLDLFSGGGGLHLAAELSGGIQTIAFSEVDKFASQVLHKRWPHIPNLGDITKIKEFPPADIICGGFPCQDISVANPNGKGLDGARSGLWNNMALAIEQTRPKGVLIENSDQLRRKGLNVILQRLSDFGYDAEWYTVAAAAVGAPHRRKRMAVVAYHRGKGGSRLVAPFGLVKARQWNWSGEEDLQQIYDSPFLPGPRWPQPLLRRMDDGLANRTHRLKVIGNGVVPPLFSQFFDLLKWRLMEYAWRC